MLIVKNYLDVSKIHGIGVFAGEKIKKGQRIWSKQEGFDQIFELKNLSHLPEVARDYIENYGYLLNEEKIILPCDNSKFINHHDCPNTDNSSADSTFALCDINEGEEIFCSYIELNPVYKFLPYVGNLK